MKYFKTALLAACCLVAASAGAQDNVDPKQETINLQKEKIKDLEQKLKGKEQELKDSVATIGRLRKQIASLSDEVQRQMTEVDRQKAEVEKQKAEVQKQKDEVKAQKESANASKLKEQEKAVKKLNDDIEALKKQLAAAEQKGKDEAQQQIADLQQQLDQQAAQLKAKDDELESQRQKLAQLGMFKREYIRSLADNIDTEWLSKKYSQLTLASLEKACQDYRQFAGDDAKVAAASKKLDALHKRFVVYNMGVTAVNSEYKADEVDRLIDQVDQLIKTETDAGRKADLEELYTQLDNYGITVDYFKDLIKAVEASIEGETGVRAAWAMAKAQLKLEEAKATDIGGTVIDAISSNPYLGRQYIDYTKALEKNCLEKSAVRNKIMSL